ncbi:MAG: InlB B-repeat-containing protein, partial [Clostridiales bacterium]|nr:InlB B-repeat-containing protein [Clostridiales bacterium]
MKQPKTRTKTILFLTVLCLIAGLALSACKVVNTYKVIFLSDDAVYATVEVKEGETINLPTDPTKEGYTFGGWVYSNDPSLTFDGSGKITASIKVTAKWILNEDPNDPTDSDEIFYTVTYVLNGGIGDYTDGEVKEGTEISALTDPTKEGYEFDGWYTTESLTGSAVAFPYTVNADTTFYAKWVEISDEYTEGLLFTPITGGYKVSVGTTENETEIVIPRTYNGEPVLEIDNSFIVCTKLVKLTVPFVGATLDGTSNVHFGYIFGASSYSEYSKVPASLREVIVTGEVSIGNLAFSRCSGLTSITLPNVTSIGYMAFYNCSGLTTITIPNVTSIGEEAFWYCSGLTTITIPKVTSIGNRAFYYCSGLTEISLPNVT